MQERTVSVLEVQKILVFMKVFESNVSDPK